MRGECELPPEPSHESPDRVAAECTLGMADAIFAYGVILANAGLVTRAQLADGFADLVRQLEAASASDARLFLPRALVTLFKLPVVGERRFHVVGDSAGDDVDEPPPRPPPSAA